MPKSFRFGMVMDAITFSAMAVAAECYAWKSDAGLSIPRPSSITTAITGVPVDSLFQY